MKGDKYITIVASVGATEVDPPLSCAGRNSRGTVKGGVALYRKSSLMAHPYGAS